jgi:plastocyanin
MIRRRLSLVAIVSLGLLGLSPLVASRADAGAVEIHDNYFTPQKIAIDTGGTLEWNAVNGGHSITADDGSFDIPEDGGVVEPGDRLSITFHQRGVFYYHCRIHGLPNTYPRGMTGAIYVGTPFEAVDEVRRVPSEYPTIEAALRGSPSGTTVLVAPGTYNQNVELTSPGVTLAGEDGVVFDGQGSKPVGIAIKAANVTLRNVSIRGFTSVSVDVQYTAPQFAVRNVDVRGSPFGVFAENVQGGAITDVRVSDAATAGIALRSCTPCGIAVERVRVERSNAGVAIDQTTGVVLRDLTLVDNATGISIANSQGVDVTGSVVSGGAVSIKVSTISVPGLDVRVRDNTVTGYSDSGLWWDLLGHRVCFSGNVDPALPDGPRSTPPLLQTLFRCS